MADRPDSAAKHTPLPWDLCWASPQERLPALITKDDEKARVSEVIAELDRGGEAEQNANATLIVRAVNAHEALVKALEGLRDHMSFDVRTDSQEKLDAMRAADAALRLAKGQQQ